MLQDQGTSNQFCKTILTSINCLFIRKKLLQDQENKQSILQNDSNFNQLFIYKKEIATRSREQAI
ncbi:MAG TPA: hypothetical protein PLB63_03210, partial [Planctomycetota bacterium]|nr:hypothetical protein [Planctomycetota bacterium]HQA99933.1 hypothetical protein [Planctomycetota bacterium]